MFDVFVTILHIFLFSGILIICLAMKVKKDAKKKSVAQKAPCRCSATCPGGCGSKSSKHSGQSSSTPSSTPIQASHLSVVVSTLFLLIAHTSHAQKIDIPDYKDGRLIWTSKTTDGEYKFYSKPKNPRALIEVSYFLEYEPASMDGSDETSATNPFGDVSGLIIKPKPGTEASIALKPFQLKGFMWNANLIEWRTNISMPGSYTVSLDLKENQHLFPMAELSMAEYSYLNFGREFGIFVAGCIVVAFLYFILTRSLTRYPAQVAHTQ